MNLLEQLINNSKEQAPARCIGIDLGTTNSTVAQVKLPVKPGASPEGSCECLHLEQPTQNCHAGNWF